MEKVKLYKTEDESFEVSLRKPTMVVKDKILDLSIKLLEEQEGIDAKYPGMPEIKNGMIKAQNRENVEEVIALMEQLNDTKIAKNFTLYSKETQSLADKYTVLKLQVFMQTRHLTEDEEKLVNSEPKSDFWRNQDLSELNSVMVFFREIHKIG